MNAKDRELVAAAYTLLGLCYGRGACYAGTNGETTDCPLMDDLGCTLHAGDWNLPEIGEEDEAHD